MKTILCAAAAALCLPFAASAATFTQDLTFSQSESSASLTQDQSGFVAYDGAQELVRVFLQFVGQAQTNFVVDGCASTPCSPAALTLNFGASGDDAAIFGLFDGIGAARPTTVLEDTDDPQFVVLGVQLQGAFELDPADFVGTGPFDALFTVDSAYDGRFNSISQAFGGTARLTFVTAAVPVPASLPLALGGLALLFGLRARARA